MSIFKKLISSRRREQHQQAIQSIISYLLGKAEQISQRALEFVKRLKQKEAISSSLFIEWRYKIKNPSISPICSKIIHQRHNEATFRCYDCMGSISSCICAECFANGDHKGHNYIQYQASNGCCDCGNQESWNEKGFCKNHGKINQLNFQIDPSVEKQYLEENGLAFWFYFYLVDSKKVNDYKELYGSEFFTYLTKISRQNYQMKYLAFKLLSNPLPGLFKDSDTDAESSILQRIFKMKPSEELNKFVELTFQVFPVEQFRILMIQEYFQMMKKKGQTFTNNHQLAMLNFQFLSCVKLINRLIKADQLKPLSIYPYIFLGNTIDLPAAFTKYYEDLDYINNMIAAKQYHILHLTMTNICDLCSYRQFSAQNKKLDPSYQYNKYNLDQIFLKNLAQFAKSIRQQKKLLEKCLRQLFQYIIMAERNFISMAHERAFALLTMAYFDGNIYQLGIQGTSNNFIKIIFDNDLVHITSNLNHILKNVFRTKLHILQLTNVQDNHSSHEKYFLKVHPEKNFCQYLDIIFQKIILMISKSHIYYSRIVKDILKQLQCIIKKSDQLSQAEQPIFYSSKNELREAMYLTNHTQLYQFLNFINSVTTVNIDQLVIANYIGIVKQQNAYTFYRRLLSTFKNLNNTELKNLVLSIINNEQVLEDFIKQHCKVEGGKIRCKAQGQPLQTYIFFEFFKRYQRNLNKVDPCFLRRCIKLPQFTNYVVIDEETAEIILEIIMNFLFNFTSFNSYDKFTDIFSLISFEYLKIYLENNSSKQKSFFHTLLQPSFRPLISKQLLQQVTLLERQENIEMEREKIKDQKQLEEKKKKQRLMAKKKQKELSMKMNKQKILNIYKTNIKEIQAQQHLNECIYCKLPKNQSLNYISYVGVTNFYEQKFMKTDDYHVYLESCGHKVHRSCFEIVLMKNKSSYCFLCKKETNILIPQHSQSKQEIKQSQIVDIIFSFQAALITQRQEMKQEVKGKDIFLMQSQKSFYQLLIKGICQDIFFIGLRDYQKYKRSRLQIHYQLISLLKGLNKYQIKQQFHNIKPKEAERYSLIIRLIQNKLEQLVLGMVEQNEHETNQKSQIVSDHIQIINKFFSTFFNEKDEENQITNLNLISSQLLFTSLPDNLGRMNMYFGECQLCDNMTNYIYICLKCEWSSCNKCLRLMHNHATYGHLDGTVFISCTNGAVKYLHGGRIFEDGSIYENYLKQSYTEIVSYAQVSKIDRYKLNTIKLQKIQEMALQYGIHQKIFINDH